MKKIISALMATALAFGASAQTFGKGDMVFDLGIGVGASDVPNYVGTISSTPIVQKTSAATFTQKIAFEYGVAQFGNLTIGVGASVGNAYGAKHDTFLSGKYNYTYHFTMYHYEKSNGRYRWVQTNSQDYRRKGTGTAKATAALEDVNVLVKGSVHYSFIPNLDVYGTFGLGFSAYKMLYSDYRSKTGFSTDRSTLNRNDTSNKYQSTYSYNDLDHVKWDDDTKADARFAMAFYVGARYFFTEHWGVNAEIGLVSAAYKASYNDYNIFSIGASYKF